MGDKARARRLADEAGVPVVPGLDGEDDATLEALRAFAAEHGLPDRDQGGRRRRRQGHARRARASEELESALDAARREAQSAFGDGRVLVERYLERPRHVEVQVLADAHGTTSTSASASARCSAATRRSSRRRRRPVVDDALRAAHGRGRGRAGAGLRLRRRRHRRVHRPPRRRRLLLPRDEHAPAGRAPGHRARLRRRPRRAAAARRRRRAAGLRDRQRLRPATRSRRASTPRTRPPGSCPRPARCGAYREPAGARVDSGIRAGSEVGTALRPAAGQGHRPRRPTGRPRWPGSTAPWPS